MNDQQIVPTGIKVIAVFYYIGALLFILFSLYLFYFGFSGISASGGYLFAGLGGVFLIMVGIFLLFLSVLNFFIGMGLWGGKNWAINLVIFFSVLAVLGILKPISEGNITKNLIPLAMHTLVGAYLIFYKIKSKESYSSGMEVDKEKLNQLFQKQKPENDFFQNKKEDDSQKKFSENFKIK